jgi:hypothetical protein
VHTRIISAVKRVEFISDRISYIILRGHWCHIIVLNVHAPTEDKIDDMKASFSTSPLPPRKRKRIYRVSRIG